MRGSRSILGGFGVALMMSACAQLFSIEEANLIVDSSEGGADAGLDTARADRDAAPPPVEFANPNVLAFAIDGELPQIRTELEKATINSGKLTAWTVAAEHPSFDPKLVSDTGDPFDPYVIWGRWSGGKTGGVFFSPPFQRTLPGWAGLHYAIGRRPPKLPPSGKTVTYEYLGGTPVTVDKAAPAPLGKVKAAGATIEFKGAATNIAFEVTLDVGDGANLTLVESEGGQAGVNGSNVGLTADGFTLNERRAQALRRTPVLGGSSGCENPDACFARISGFLAGDAYDRLAIVIDARHLNGSGDEESLFHIVVVFKPK